MQVKATIEITYTPDLDWYPRQDLETIESVDKDYIEQVFNDNALGSNMKVTSVKVEEVK